MKALFRYYLVNEPYKDPALYIELFGRKNCFLIDLGDISKLPAKKILKISHIFVTHTHIDHFFGFDALLRTSLGKKEPIHIYGPKHITRNVKGKLAGYTWNLIKEYPLNIYVHEINKRSMTTTLFSAERGLKANLVEKKVLSDNVIYEDDELIVKTLILSHKIPVLCFLLEEKIKINVKKDALRALNLEPGPWLSDLKKRFLAGECEGEFTFLLKGKKYTFPADELAKKLLLINKGEKILYITDVRYSSLVLKKLKEFSYEPDVLFCEAFFLHLDKERAKERYHLTAKQTNVIAKTLKAKKLFIFHFSPRYKGNFRKIYEEAYVGLK